MVFILLCDDVGSTGEGGEEIHVVGWGGDYVLFFQACYFLFD